MHRTLHALLLAALPALAAAQAAPDRLVLKDRTSLEGRIEAQQDKAVVFVLRDGTRRTVARTGIRAIQPGGKDQGIYGLQPPADAGGPPKTYVRCDPGVRCRRATEDRPAQPGRSGNLSTAVSRWYHAATDTTLWQVGVVHIGEQPYYTRLQQILDSADLVLFEGVTKGDTDISEEQLASMTALGKLQMAMKDALGLEFQKQAMDYARPFWKNADVDWMSLRAEMDRNDARLPTDNPIMRGLLSLVAGVISGAKKDRATHDLLRARLAPILARADEILAGRMKKMGDSIIVFRNDAAMKALRAELKAGPKGRTLAQFWGAGHMPDLDRRLLKDGWVCQGVDWLEAWRFAR